MLECHARLLFLFLSEVATEATGAALVPRHRMEAFKSQIKTFHKQPLALSIMPRPVEACQLILSFFLYY